MRTLEQLWPELAEWSQATFGTDAERGPTGALKHLALEVAEVQAEPNDLTEYADCLILIFDAARRAGFDLVHLVNAAHNKLAINKARSWGKPVSDEPVLHTKE